MLNKNKKWIYTGPELGLDFDDIPIPKNEEAIIPDSLKPTDEMQERFRKEAEKLGLMKQVDIVKLVCINGILLEE